MADTVVTYEDIHRLLMSLGFTCEERATERRIQADPPRQHVVYRHEKKGTVLKFPSKEARPCLQGELNSLRVHLVGRGHLDADAIAEFAETGQVSVLQ